MVGVEMKAMHACYTFLARTSTCSCGWLAPCHATRWIPSSSAFDLWPACRRRNATRDQALYLPSKTGRKVGFVTADVHRSRRAYV